ncbi:ATP-binding protein [Paenibacillus puerhi]|uniref:ATP-binding protein n=1 Tax=Paenibacillus puerhi TaxID=2692622 RepID=UPI00135C567F|nr:ATP-binding protein [Paenibacillus puerhi]
MKKDWCLGLGILVLFACILWCLTVAFRFPYLGLYVDLNGQREWEITDIDRQGSASKLNIQVGDKIELIDGRPPGDSLVVQKWRTVEQARELVITRDGQRLSFAIVKDGILAYDVVPLIGSLTSLFMSALLITRVRQSPSARLLSLVFLACGLIWASQGASVRGDALGKFLIANFMMALQILFLHFLLVFFKEKGSFSLPLGFMKYLYAVLFAGFLIRILYFIPPWAYFAYLTHNPLTLTFFVFGFVLNISLLGYLYVRHRQEKTYFASILRSVWVCLFISFAPFICFTVLPKLIGNVQVAQSEYTSIFILFFPLCFAYLIMSDQLYDIGNVLRRLLFAIAMAVIPCGVLTGLYATIFPDDLHLQHLVFLFAASVGLVALVLYSAEYFTPRLERLVFPRRHALQASLKKMSRRLEQISSFGELKDVLLTDIVSTLEIAGAAIVFQYPDAVETVAEGAIDPGEIEQLLASSALMNHPGYTCLEINRHEEYASYMILTRKKTNMRLVEEELQWLRLITTYLAVSMENLHLTRKLTLRLQQLASRLPAEQEAPDIQWFRKLMFELQETERIRIASDLHDTTMQDLFFLKRRFAALLEKVALNPDEQAHVNNIINFVELIHVNLRQSCFELNPSMLNDIGLVATVRMWLDQEAYHSPFQIEFITENTAVIEQVDILKKKHIFRIIQEWLNNAKKHSQASRVTFKMEAADHVFCLLYEDDGVGFDDQVVEPREHNRSGIGMEQLKGRVHFLHGKMELKASPGEGVKYRVTLPV